MIEYRQFCPDDIDQARELFVSCVDDYEHITADLRNRARQVTREKYRSAEYLSSIYCIVAVADGQIVAMGGLDGNQVKRMRVSPARRFEGIARTIYQMLEKEACEHGLLSLETNSSMNAVGFYERMGFTCVGENTWDFHGVTVHNPVMIKEL